ncbi:MAG: response regulator transcription factor [Treponemataceae bacterium]|nr:response regulator transcription factor [Treponemataceae bacterium]
MARILIVDDEKEIIDLLTLYLEKDGFSVTGALDGETGLKLLSQGDFDCVLLDIMIPNINGFNVLKSIRKASAVPVIIISAKITSSDKILGLDLGADDYVTKPFDPLEVLARVKTNLRRFSSGTAKSALSQSQKKSIVVPPYELNLEECLFYKRGEAVEITATEFQLLRPFLESPNKVFTKQQLIEAGWPEQKFVEDNSIMVALSKLRSKMDENYSIKNIRGLGYRLEIK